jgi:Zn-dependent protease
MRDPMSWAVRVFTAYGIPVKVHLFFFVFTIGMFLRQVLPKDNPIWWVDVLLFTVILLFGIILLHEFGHCFAARYVDGEAREILIWPLGGLAYVEVPHNWRANFIVAAGGPMVNVIICVVCAGAMASAGYLPSLNPIRNPYTAEVYNYRQDHVEASRYGSGAGIAEAVKKTLQSEWKQELSAEQWNEVVAHFTQSGKPQAPLWVVWAYRAFWLSWVLLLFNLIPAYPLDGGQMLQALVWGRTDYRRGVVVAAYTGFAVAIVFLIVSIASNEALFMGLSLFMLYMASMKLYSLDTEDGPFGYDFSAGYTSLERDDEPPPRPKRQGFLTRWLQARKARKIQREAEQRAADEERMDQILAKIAESGKSSLTDDERRFLERYSARYRPRAE